MLGRRMPTLLVVHHTASPSLHSMFEAVMSGATDPRIEGVDVVSRPALAATAVDVLAADGYLLGTPANLGYISGALKHFFDQIYYPCLDATARRPYGLYVHGSPAGGTSTAAGSWGRHWQRVSVSRPDGAATLWAVSVLSQGALSFVGHAL